MVNDDQNPSSPCSNVNDQMPTETKRLLHGSRVSAIGNTFDIAEDAECETKSSSINLNRMPPKRKSTVWKNKQNCKAGERLAITSKQVYLSHDTNDSKETKDRSSLLSPLASQRRVRDSMKPTEKKKNVASKVHKASAFNHRTANRVQRPNKLIKDGSSLE